MKFIVEKDRKIMAARTQWGVFPCLHLKMDKWQFHVDDRKYLVNIEQDVAIWQEYEHDKRINMGLGELEFVPSVIALMRKDRIKRVCKLLNIRAGYDEDEEPFFLKERNRRYKVYFHELEAIMLHEYKFDPYTAKPTSGQ